MASSSSSSSFSLLSILMISATILFFPSLTTSQPSTIIPASPALPENSPPLSPYEELSPDIAPLLPTPGGELPSPSVASIPTIPSNPSTPNPDEFAAAQGPAAAAYGPSFSPLGSLPVSSAFSHNSPYLALSVLCSAIFSIQLLKTWSS